MKKKVKTFAQRARDIEKKYSRAKFDAIEARDMEAELEALMNEQEAFRNAMGMNEERQMSTGGYSIEEGDDKSSLIPSKFATNSAIELNRQFPHNVSIPSDFQLQTDMLLAPNYRDIHRKIPLSTNLVGVQPGVSEVMTSAQGTPYKKGIPASSVSIGLDNTQLGYYGTADSDPGMSMFDTPQYKQAVARNTAKKYTDKVVPNYTKTNNNQSPLRDYTLHPLTMEELATKGEPWVKPTVNNTRVEKKNSSTPVNTSRKVQNTKVSDSQINQSVQEEINKAWDEYNTIEKENPLQMEDWMYNVYKPSSTYPMDSSLKSEIDKKLDKVTRKIDNKEKRQQFWDKNKQYLPYALSGLANIGGNLALANFLKKNKPQVNAPMVSPERINLSPEVEKLQKQAITAKNVNIRNARNLGLNAGSAMANISAGNSAVNRGLGENITSLRTNEALQNAQLAQQASMANAGYKANANNMNAQLDQQNLAQRASLLDDTIGTIPGVMKDIRQDKADKEMRDIMDRAYQSQGRNYMHVGSIFEEGGQEYIVREVDATGKPLRIEPTKKAKSKKDKTYGIKYNPQTNPTLSFNR